MYDLIIIGGGPAGITAGIYAVRKKLETLLITLDFIGQVGKSFLIENYPGFKEIKGSELAGKLREHIKGFDIELKEGEKVSKIEKKKDIFVVKTSQKEYKSRTVIVATGRDPRPLEVQGEKKFLGKGVSYCVTCDGPLFSGKTVAVIGGGNSGFEAALELGGYCKRVYILERGSTIVADEVLQEKVTKSKNVEVLLNTDTKEIKGEEFVKSLIYQNLKEKKKKEIKVEGVFVQVGYIPATGYVKNLVDFNDQDEIKIDPHTNRTRTQGLFAAGDVTDIKIKQIITAAGEGAKAALSAYKYLQD